ncbi:hypothetical protein [Streptomyces sp. NPDC048106]
MSSAQQGITAPHITKDQGEHRPIRDDFARTQEDDAGQVSSPPRTTRR